MHQIYVIDDDTGQPLREVAERQSLEAARCLAERNPDLLRDPGEAMVIADPLGRVLLRGRLLAGRLVWRAQAEQAEQD